MINSLFKSFVNSIGRTLGRIFAYLIIALLLFYFLGGVNK